VQDVTIIGGGISGLSAAYHLTVHRPSLGVTLLEAAPELGGKVRTDRVAGYVIEGGPDSFLASKPPAIELCDELGIAGHLQSARADTRRTFVMRHGRLHDLPSGLSGLVPAQLGPLFRSDLFSLSGKGRIALERFIPPRRDATDESLGSFVRRRFGSQAYNRLIEPLMAGIYGGNGDNLSLAATFPQLREMEVRHGSVLKGVTAPRPPGATGGRAGFLAPVGGMGELIEALVPRLGAVNIRCSTSVQRIERTGEGYAVELDTGEMIEAHAVIIATPAHAAAHLLETVAPPLAETLCAIPYSSSVTLSMAYREEDVARALGGYGYIIPKAEGRPVLACTWTSSKFAGRAPDGFALIRLFFGRGGRESLLRLSDDELTALARDELRTTLGISAMPLLVRLFRWPDAMPQYTPGHLKRLARIHAYLSEHPTLRLCGAAYSGIGVPDCIRSGKLAAEALSTQ
jgi:protoporphyrinogen/coproporphyrinogen III oxidase